MRTFNQVVQWLDEAIDFTPKRGKIPLAKEDAQSLVSYGKYLEKTEELLTYDVDIYDGEWHTNTVTVEVTAAEVAGIVKLMHATKGKLGVPRITLISLSLEGMEDYGNEND